MAASPSMLNGHDVMHGGFIFALADTAFAYACNSRNETNVALNAAISFTAPGRAGQRLVATAQERSHGGRTGIYDVEVRNDVGRDDRVLSRNVVSHRRNRYPVLVRGDQAERDGSKGDRENARDHRTGNLA